jgi:hypothetical protein
MRGEAPAAGGPPLRHGMSQVQSARMTDAQLQRVPWGADEAGGGRLPQRTTDGEFLVGGDGSGPVLGVIRREAGRFYCYPCTPEFPRLGPFERLEHATRAVTAAAAGRATGFQPG